MNLTCYGPLVGLDVKAAPSFGFDTRKVLFELGYDKDQIEDLIDKQVVYEFLPGLGAKGTYFFNPEP